MLRGSIGGLLIFAEIEFFEEKGMIVQAKGAEGPLPEISSPFSSVSILPTIICVHSQTFIPVNHR